MVSFSQYIYVCLSKFLLFKLLRSKNIFVRSSIYNSRSFIHCLCGQSQCLEYTRSLLRRNWVSPSPSLTFLFLPLWNTHILHYCIYSCLRDNELSEKRVERTQHTCFCVIFYWWMCCSSMFAKNQREMMG